jgi:hypothetical protein
MRKAQLIQRPMRIKCGCFQTRPAVLRGSGPRKNRILITIPRDSYLARKLLLLLHNDMKSDNPSNDDSVLRQAILNYLDEHPDAMEALDGIAEWWIARSQIRVEVEALGRVLEELTRSGVLKEMRVTGKTYYRLARKKVN